MVKRKIFAVVGVVLVSVFIVSLFSGCSFISGGFVLEGKWKNTSNTTLGQASPGAIVAFDGTNCNFFSPKDTYAYYEAGDHYVLECTSFLFNRTLSFTIFLIDNDNIEISYGNQKATFARIG